jgi:hypothetical protein
MFIPFHKALINLGYSVRWTPRDFSVQLWGDGIIIDAHVVGGAFE